MAVEPRYPEPEAPAAERPVPAVKVVVGPLPEEEAEAARPEAEEQPFRALVEREVEEA